MSAAEAYLMMRERTDWIRDSNGFFSSDFYQEDDLPQNNSIASIKTDWIRSTKSAHGIDREPRNMIYDRRLAKHPAPVRIYYDLGLRENENIQSLFLALAEAWEKETLVVSSLEKSVLNESYQRIIGLGPVAIPLILKRLQCHGGNWFWALRAISGDDPISVEDFGNFKKMRQIWLSWGVDRGLISVP